MKICHRILGEIRSFVVESWKKFEEKYDNFWSMTKKEVIRIFERSNENFQGILGLRSIKGNIS